MMLLSVSNTRVKLGRRHAVAVAAPHMSDPQRWIRTEQEDSLGEHVGQETAGSRVLGCNLSQM